MPHWLIKSGTQRVLSWLPYSYWWNTLFQKYGTRGWNLRRDYFELILEDCRKHFDSYLAYSPHARQDFTAFELGTGWYPIVPLGLYLCGASKVITYDLFPWLHRDTVSQTLQMFCEFGETGRLVKVLPKVRPERITKLRELRGEARHSRPPALLKKLGISIAVGDARHTPVEAKSIDLILSNTVLEMISRPVLAELFTEFKRICSADGVMSHCIGLRDMFGGFDHTITPFNFLQYSSKAWRVLDSPLYPQNRLRMPEYRTLFGETRCSILRELNSSGSLELLRQIKLAPEFQKYSTEDLLVLETWIVARPAGLKRQSGNS